MENNEHVHAVMWAARRAGLYYVPINTHLTAAEAAYIFDNSSAKAIVGSGKLSATLAGLAAELPNGLPTTLLIADGDLVGWQSYPECVADQSHTPIAYEIEGDLLQYSSGTTGRPEGIKRKLPHVPPADAPGLMAALVAFWMRPDAVYLSPAPLYHTAPSLWSMQTQAGGITVVMEKYEPQWALRCHRQAPRHARPVRSSDVHPNTQVTDGCALFLRRFEPRTGYARGGTMPDRDQKADERLVGPDHRRVLRLI